MQGPCIDMQQHSNRSHISCFIMILTVDIVVPPGPAGTLAASATNLPIGGASHRLNHGEKIRRKSKLSTSHLVLPFEKNFKHTDSSFLNPFPIRLFECTCIYL